MGGAGVSAGPSAHTSPFARQASYVLGKHEMSEKGTADKATPLDLSSMEDHGPPPSGRRRSMKQFHSTPQRHPGQEVKGEDSGGPTPTNLLLRSVSVTARETVAQKLK